MTSDGRRVLLVDDAPEVRLLLQLLLELEGWTVICSDDGPSGLAAAQMQDLDLMLLDVQLPGLDGPDVLRALRSEPSTAALPVVFLTGAAPEQSGELLALGATGVLHKPFDPDTVVARLTDLL